MTKTLHVIFDGEVLRPEETSDLEPNAHYLITESAKKNQRRKVFGMFLIILLDQLRGLKTGHKSMTIIYMACQNKGKDK